MNEDFETVFPLPWYAVVLIILLCWPSMVFAEPMYLTTTPNGTVITLHSEKCQLTEVVNLPKRATWREGIKTFEGCWGLSPLGLVMFYFDDKTVAMVPADSFQRVQGV